MTAPQHGTFTRYKSRKHKCRCDQCRTAYAEWMRAYRERDGVKEREAAASARYRAARPKPERPPARAQPTLRRPDFVGTITLEEYRRWRT